MIPATAFLAVATAASCSSRAGVQPAGARSSAGTAVTPTAAVTARPAGPPQQTTDLTNLALTSPQRGYGLFTRITGGRCQALSGYTADGGARFGAASVIANWNCDDSAPVTAITADGAGDVFAYGPDFLAVRNRAGGWRSKPKLGSVLAVSAVGRSVWMLLAECHSAAISATGCTLRLVDSADGGQSWRTSGTAPPGAVTSGSSAGPAGTEEALGQSWLVRTGPSAGYVFASPAVNSRGRPDFAVLWYTSDAGAAWSLRHVPCGFDALSDAVAAAPDGVLAVVCASEPSAGYQVKTTVISTNGGLTWTLHAGCLFRQGCRDLLDGGYLGQIAAVSGQTIYLVGSRSSLLVTRDGGLHWRVVRPFIGDSGDGTSRVIFFGQSDGVVLGAGGAANGRSEIFRTLDGGRTWSTVLPQLS